jgi:NAD(P)-dependent dehydrogenase (short-subunit alcohol dehydrogenase family)
MGQLLQNKSIVIYGAGGGLGSGFARTFAAHGATVFLAGRTGASVEEVAASVTAAGGVAHVAEVDALDEAAVETYLDSVVASAGSIDASCNLVSRGDRHGLPIVEMPVDDIVGPVANGFRSTVVTARAAARRMAAQGSGVILQVTSGSSGGQAPGMGGTSAADAAVEAFLRNVAQESGPDGVRTAVLWTAGVFHSELMAPMTALKRGPSLEEVAETAAFLASDRASGITGTITNVTCGLVIR